MAKTSHEVRTALDVIIGYSELLLEDADLEEREVDQRRLARITLSSRQMLGLIADSDQLAESGLSQVEAPSASDERRNSVFLMQSLRPAFRVSLGPWLRAASATFHWGIILAAAATALLAFATSGSPLHALASTLLVLGGSVLARGPRAPCRSGH